ncbi:unnamed protein product [Calicophoron daubneyi]|uniref:Geranylgeranyl transferase type-2 subunit beta n=1 Tax=Calicophoron daubneyi TaxID=300641 RepID=A0AAV2SWG0_CALDB
MAHPLVDIVYTDSMPNGLLLRKHIDFLKNYAKKDDCTLDYLKLSGIFWTLTALDLLGDLNTINKDTIIDLVLSCQKPDGGFSPAPNHDSHLLSTLSGIQILAMFDAVDRMDVDSAVRFILSLHQSDGSFYGDQWGEIDTRFSFCAIASLKLLGRWNECVSSGQIDPEACASYLERCQNLDGGFGTQPGSESHAGQAYCVLGALALLQQLRRLDLERAAWWLAERQLPSGGLNGRPEKKPDVCYSWWTLASLTILGKIAWIDEQKLTRFILAAQDADTGGIADRPGDVPDPFHTLFGLAGLGLLSQGDTGRSLAIENGTVKAGDDVASDSGPCSGSTRIADTMSLIKKCLKVINPVFCMPQYIIDRMQITVQIVN